VRKDGLQAALADEELYLCIDVDAAGGEALVRQASAIERAWLPEEGVTIQIVVEFDESSGKVTARKKPGGKRS
jgi:ATP-dependent helicase HrpB